MHSGVEQSLQFKGVVVANSAQHHPWHWQGLTVRDLADSLSTLHLLLPPAELLQRTYGISWTSFSPSARWKGTAAVSLVLKVKARNSLHSGLVAANKH